MKALLLAAGKGKRLAQVTKTLPKPMVEIEGKPILEHNILMLKNSDIFDIYINLHHLPEIIQDYFEDGSKWGMNINYVYEEELLGTSGAVKNCKTYFQDRFLVVYGDNLFDSNLSLKNLIDFHKKNESSFTMGLCEVEDISQSGTVELDKSNKITKLIEKPATDGIIKGWVNAGIYLIESSLIDLIPTGNSDFSNDFIPFLLDSDYNVYAHKLERKVIPIDTPTRLEQAIK